MTVYYKQLKLTNGDEMICELVEPSDDDNVEIVVRKAMKIIVNDDLDEGVRYYTLKPWISFQDHTDDLVVINSMHVIAEAIPSDTIIPYYQAAIKDADKYNAVRAAGLSLKDIQEKMGELTEEEMEEFMQKKYEELEEEAGIEVEFDDVDIRYDSDSPNVIHFRRKTDTFH
tara:strand:- start:6103 stop:6615 length:513 start_codon:yes stop_codon:yes gene_type:complete